MRPGHSDRPPAQEESPLRSSFGEAALTTENLQISRIYEKIRKLTWSTKPDSNWRPSRWQRVAIVEFIDVYVFTRA